MVLRKGIVAVRCGSITDHSKTYELRIPPFVYFLCGMGSRSDLIVFYVDLQLSYCSFWKLSCPQGSAVLPLSQKKCLYRYGSISVFCIFFSWSIFFYPCPNIYTTNYSRFVKSWYLAEQVLQPDSSWRTSWLFLAICISMEVLKLAFQLPLPH